MMNGNGNNLAVRVSGVTKSFGEGRARVETLRGVDLEIEPNKLIMLVGPSGCGKTTLVSIISGVLAQDGGEVEVFGERWSELSDAERTRRRGALVSYIFQNFNLIPTLTTNENAAIPLLIRNVPRAEALERAAAILDDVGLGDRLTARPAELSGGMQQRVAIARSLCASPRLLVCDEPTASLDGKTGQQVMELIHRTTRTPGKANNEHGRCVIVVTHDNRIFHFADRIEEMEDGRIVGRHDPKEYERVAAGRH